MEQVVMALAVVGTVFSVYWIARFGIVLTTIIIVIYAALRAIAVAVYSVIRITLKCIIELTRYLVNGLVWCLDVFTGRKRTM